MKSKTNNAPGAEFPSPRTAKASNRTENRGRRLQKILVAVDFSSPSVSALHSAVAYAKRLGGSLVLMHAVSPANYQQIYISPEPPFFEALDTHAIKVARGKLAALKEQKVSRDIPTELVVKLGRPCDEIIKVAQQENVELIIIATHGRTGLKHVFLGSTAERVVRLAPCPVLVVREQENDFSKT